MEAEQPQPSILDMFFNMLEQLLLPDWSDLIRLLPWVIGALVVGWLVFTAVQWRRAGARNRSRVPRPLNGGAPPAGVHLPGPSRWPFVAPIGGALILFSFALPTRDASGAPVSPINTTLFIAGLIVSIIAIGGWLLEAMREWRATAAADQLGAGSVHQAHALTPGATARWSRQRSAPIAQYAEPPEGVHMPGPSPWPFLAPIAMVLILFGLVFSAVLIIGGLILGVIAAAGWLIDAGHEYKSTEEVGHAVPATRDPVAVWPKRLIPIFVAVIALSLLVTLAPVGINWLNSLTPAEATDAPVAVPEVPEISASTITSFDTSTLIVPAARPFDLIFNNNQEGVPHNVEIADSAERTTVYLDGAEVTGVASITYNVEALAEGSYYFLCAIHPNMNGTVEAMPETGGPPPAGGPAPGQSPAEQASPSP